MIRHLLSCSEIDFQILLLFGPLEAMELRSQEALEDIELQYRRSWIYMELQELAREPVGSRKS